LVEKEGFLGGRKTAQVKKIGKGRIKRKKNSSQKIHRFAGRLNENLIHFKGGGGGKGRHEKVTPKQTTSVTV